METGKLLITVLTPLLISLAKRYLPDLMDRIPKFMIPLIAGLIGIISGSFAGVDVVGAAQAGLAGTGIREVGHQIKKNL